MRCKEGCAALSFMGIGRAESPASRRSPTGCPNCVSGVTGELEVAFCAPAYYEKPADGRPIGSGGRQAVRGDFGFT
jgi:hypothetical protein